jgi:hypothetical protein
MATKNIYKDKNDKLMAQAGFFRDPVLDRPYFNAIGVISYWLNDKGISIITTKADKITLKKLCELIADNAAYKTRNRIRKEMLKIDKENGFVND